MLEVVKEICGKTVINGSSVILIGSLLNNTG